MNLKYIIFKEGKLVFPILFPEHCVHSSFLMATAFDKATGKPIISDKGPPAQIMSAGFCYIDEDGLQIEDRPSVSLGIGPNHKVDRQILERAMAGMGTSFFLIDEEDNLLL